MARKRISMPRSRSPKGLRLFCRTRTTRIMDQLEAIGGAYGDVDQYIVEQTDALMEKIIELEQAFDEAVEAGRGAL